MGLIRAASGRLATPARWQCVARSTPPIRLIASSPHVLHGSDTTNTPPPLNPLAEQLAGSGIRKIMALAWELQAAEPDNPVIRLEVGQPNFATPKHVIDATVEALNHVGNQGYIQSAGLPELRAAVADMYTARHVHPTRPEQVLATHGAMFSMATALMATITSGDDVLVPDPGFPNYTEAVSLMHARPVYFPCRPENGWLPTLDDIAARCTPQTKMIMLASPGNPTGAVAPLSLLDDILSFANERNLYVLSDEIYGDLYHASSTGEPAPSVMDSQNFDDARAMVISGVSKAYSMTGFRVGWLRASERIIDVGIKLQEPFVSCGVAFAQRGAVAALRGPSEATDTMRKAYRARRDIALNILRKHGLADYTPEGAFYILVKCGGDSTEFARNLLINERVAVAPGATFGDLSEGYVRISFASSDEDVDEGVSRLCHYITSSS
eukprot:m.35807 g.35807  ORF g.35807 m.35807 type:complete len:439 (+) comp5328_c0_seq1:1-1317(+)